MTTPVVIAKDSLSKLFLVSSPWYTCPDEDRGLSISFQNDNTFHIYCVGECGGGQIDGKYTIFNSKVSLIVKNKTVEFESSEISDQTLFLSEDTSHPICTYKLNTSDNTYIYYRYKSRVKPGMIRIIDGNKLIITETKTIKVKESSRIRSGPGISFKPYEISFKDKTTTECYLNKEMQVLGHSENRDNIKGVYDYWYFVMIYWDMYSYESGPTYGWIHGSVIQ